MTTNLKKVLDVFPNDYTSARARFRLAAERLGGRIESHAIAPRGPSGEELALDAVRFGPPDAHGLLALSSGLHGVEGFFGSAVQVAALEHASITQSLPPGIGVLFLHALNPYGFAWVRRPDESNIDPNRNFLLPGQRYEGCPDGYRRLESLLNPKRPPARFDGFHLIASAAALWHGRRTLGQAIPAGQYEYPQGLFYGGTQPGSTHRILAANLPRWIGSAGRIVHLDFHTGLGRSGSYKLLLETARHADRLPEYIAHFGQKSLSECGGATVEYLARGGLATWCEATFPDRDYNFLCAEFGTHAPLDVLAGLRAENQAHHWGKPDEPGTLRAKRRLKELFCPAAEAWRHQVIAASMQLIGNALRFAGS